MRVDRDVTAIDQRTTGVLHVSGFLLPIILFLYGLLIVLDIIDPLRYVNVAVFSMVTIGWSILGTYQLAVASRSRTESATRLVAYHAFAIAYILLVTGFSMPFICTWAVLFLASYEFFSRTGLRLSILALFITAIADTVINIGNSQYLMANLLTLVGVFIVGMISVTISQMQRVDRKELTDAKTETAHERDRIMTLVNNLADAIISVDQKGEVQMYNAATLGLLDTNLELIGAPIDKILALSTKDGKSFKLSTALKSAKGVVVRDDIRATISEEIIRLSVTYSPVRSIDSPNTHATDGYIIILRDITKQKSLEEERDEFISVVSHELRTPITIAEGTLGNVQVMMGRADIPQATLQSNVDIAHEQVMFLAKMVNDLSTLSRAERGVADEAEEIDVATLIHDLYNEYAPQAQAKHLQFNLELDPQPGKVVASPLYLKELLQNFITNAIKYTKEGSVTVRVKKQGTSLHFAVIDTGIGISKSDQTHVFEKFWRSEDYRTRETGGTGLGLYVTRKLAKKLSTTIDMSSRLNHGSAFSFELPAHKK